MYLYILILYKYTQLTGDATHQSVAPEAVDIGAQMYNEAPVFVFEVKHDKL